MKPLWLVSAMALLIPGSVSAAEALIVVEDRGGVSALPYFRALGSSEKARPASASSQAAPPVRSPGEAESALLPVRSSLLTPGDAPRRALHLPGFRPLFLVGDDARSRAWLKARHAALRELNASGLVVNGASPEALAALRALAPGVRLSPASGDELARRLGLSHYPALITATGIEP